MSTDDGRSWRATPRSPGTSLLSVGAGWTSCLAVGTHGAILSSTDGGRRWASCSADRRRGSGGMTALSPLEAWAVGDAGTMLRVAEGIRWTAVPPPVAGRLDAVAFAADGRGCAVGAAGVIVATGDAGTRWDLVPSPVTSALYDVALTPPAPGGPWAPPGPCCARRRRRHVAAQHPAWTPTPKSTPYARSGDERAVAVGGDASGQGRAVVLLIANVGRSWRTAQVDVWGELRDVAFSGALEGCAVGADDGADGDQLTGAIVRTADGGATWTQVAARRRPSRRSRSSTRCTALPVAGAEPCGAPRTAASRGRWRCR